MGPLSLGHRVQPVAVRGESFPWAWPSDLLDAEPRLKAYKERCEARPAFQRALAAQLEPFARRGG